LSETKGEIEYVLSLYKQVPGFEDVKTYTEIYDRCGFLTPKTIMGHGIYLSDGECRLLKKRKTAIAHCPTSNAPVKQNGLGSGLFNFKKIESFKIPWALGSDIGGGPYLSMFDVIESFVAQNHKKKIKEATYTKAFYRSTIAGAKILGLEKQVGTISKDKEANFIIVPMSKKTKNTDKVGAEEVLKDLVYPLRNKREKYQELVLETYHLGQQVFTRD
jgi:guanine deaminase